MSTTTEEFFMTTTMEATTGTKLRAIVNTGDLRNVVSNAMTIIKKRSPKPVIDCVLLETTDDGLLMSATDLDRYMRQTIKNVQVESIGRVAVNASALNDAIKFVTDDVVAMSEESTRLVIRTQSGKFPLATLPANDYPTGPAEVEGAPVHASGEIIASLLNQVSWATREDGGKYGVPGVLLRATAGYLNAIATDNRKVAKVRIAVENKLDIDAVLPLDSVRAIVKMLPDAGDVSFSTNDHLAQFVSDNFRFTTTLLERKLSDVDQVIAKRENADTVFRSGRDDLLSVVRQAAAFADELNSCMRIEASKSGLNIRCRSDRGESEISFPCKVDGKPVAFGIDAEYMIQALVAFPSNEVEGWVVSPSRPIVLANADWTGAVAMMNLGANKME